MNFHELAPFFLKFSKFLPYSTIPGIYSLHRAHPLSFIPILILPALSHPNPDPISNFIKYSPCILIYNQKITLLLFNISNSSQKESSNCIFVSNDSHQSFFTFEEFFGGHGYIRKMCLSKKGTFLKEWCILGIWSFGGRNRGCSTVVWRHTFSDLDENCDDWH